MNTVSGLVHGNPVDHSKQRAGPLSTDRPCCHEPPEGQDYILVRTAVWEFAMLCNRETMDGSLEVMRVRQPPSMFTTSRVSLPLATAPRMSLHSGQR